MDSVHVGTVFLILNLLRALLKYRGAATKRHLCRRISVTFSIIIVENRETRLSKSFLGPAETKTDVPYPDTGRDM
jgi:hypothetical protein